MPITNQPSPQRQTVLTFLTPNVQDLLFFETVDAQRVGRKPPAYGTPHPDTVNFPDHILAYVSQADPNGQLYYYYYANTRSSQDDYNFEYAQSSLGDVKFDTVVRTYVTLRSEFEEDSADNEAGAAMPTAPASANFEGKGYVLMTRNQQRIGDRELDGVFVVEQKTYFIPESLNANQWDDLSSRNLKSRVNFYYYGQTPAGETSTIEQLMADGNNDYWTINMIDDPYNSGHKIAFIREGRQVSADWFEVVYKELVAGPASGDVITLDTIVTTSDYYWPPVFANQEKQTWEKHDGTESTFYAYEFSPDGYSGPCKTQVTVSWSPSPQNTNTASAMVPEAINLTTPYFKIVTPPCLHGSVNLDVFVGTSDPVYKSAGLSYTKEATNYTTWPSSIIAKDEQESFRGGYLRSVYEIYQPSRI